jgi:hypothetical protein
MAKQSDLRKANTILEQLGGAGKLTAMIGAHTFMGTEEGTLTFQFRAKAHNGANRIHIVLNANDYYDVTFYKGRGVNIRAIGSVYDVPAGSLRRVIQDATQLYLSL